MPAQESQHHQHRHPPHSTHHKRTCALPLLIVSLVVAILLALDPPLGLFRPSTRTPDSHSPAAMSSGFIPRPTGKVSCAPPPPPPRLPTSASSNPLALLGTDSCLPLPHRVGYFVNWGIYARAFKPEHIPVDDLTHILYCPSLVSLLPQERGCQADDFPCLSVQLSPRSRRTARSSSPTRGPTSRCASSPLRSSAESPALARAHGG